MSLHGGLCVIFLTLTSPTLPPCIARTIWMSWPIGSALPLFSALAFLLMTPTASLLPPLIYAQDRRKEIFFGHIGRWRDLPLAVVGRRTGTPSFPTPTAWRKEPCGGDSVCTSCQRSSGGGSHHPPT
eukprot:GGOE01026865.1.p3 GENE.GGOE01026865.1~~GGOE01026865.1.p3  ORF type:complete len:127 (+),score=11.30 GGOE01026865.1:797-1177(+)